MVVAGLSPLKYTHFVIVERGLKPSPLLGKGGVAAPSKRCCEATESGADGVVGSKKIVLESERTTPSAPFIGTGIFLDGASTPPLPRRGVCSAQAFSKIKCVYFTGRQPVASGVPPLRGSVRKRLRRGILDYIAIVQNPRWTWDCGWKIIPLCFQRLPGTVKNWSEKR